MPTHCSEIEPLLPAYALGALDVVERKQVERHIGSCADCTEILAEFDLVTDGLLHAAPIVDPPPRIRSRIIAALDEGLSAAALAKVRRRLSSPALGVGILALFLLNIALLGNSIRLQRRIDSLSAQQQANRSALALSYAAGARRIELRGDAVSGALLLAPDAEVAVVYLSGLEPLPSKEAYQAWLISPDGNRTSGGLLRPEPGSEFTLLVIQSPQPLGEFVGFGMTIEPSGGSPDPTGPNVVRADL